MLAPRDARWVGGRVGPALLNTPFIYKAGSRMRFFFVASSWTSSFVVPAPILATVEILVA